MAVYEFIIAHELPKIPAIIINLKFIHFFSGL